MGATPARTAVPGVVDAATEDAPCDVGDCSPNFLLWFPEAHRVKEDAMDCPMASQWVREHFVPPQRLNIMPKSRQVRRRQEKPTWRHPHWPSRRLQPNAKPKASPRKMPSV